jgi:hypothetical protein
MSKGVEPQFLSADMNTNSGQTPLAIADDRGETLPSLLSRAGSAFSTLDIPARFWRPSGSPSWRCISQGSPRPRTKPTPTACGLSPVPKAVWLMRSTPLRKRANSHALGARKWSEERTILLPPDFVILGFRVSA